MVERYSRGTNNHMVTIGNVEIYYSYKTVIAFREDGELTARTNDWSSTTGRHMNDVPGNVKENRINGPEFEKAYNAFLVKHGLE